MNNRLRSIMFVGTGSDVGKSFISAGFCRVFRQDGYHPAPFKAQNMSLNSYVTPEGLEIGRAQAVQAEACGIPCHTDMNPVLLKPTTDNISQVILNGKPAGNFSAAEYFEENGSPAGRTPAGPTPAGRSREALFDEVKKAYHRLARRYSPIVMEGAGSISELNLKHRDITNMRMSIAAGAATYLIADIDRGGVFGSLYGTMALLDAEEKKHIKGIIINKFRGDARLFDGGRAQLEKLCGVPVIGVLPLFRDLFIEEEDSLAGKQRSQGPVNGKVNIAVVLLRRLSNFTDFDRLERDPRINLYYAHQPGKITDADIIILPGSKNTIEDLLTLKENGMAEAIQRAHNDKKTIIGICGGYQMMGHYVEDPAHVESGHDGICGLGLLPVTTVMQQEKITRQAAFRFRNLPEPCTGYEIHMGHTRMLDSPPDGRLVGTPDERHLAIFPDGRTDGYFLDDKCWGTYLHGLLDNPSVIDALIAPYTDLPGDPFDYRQYKEEQYDKLAALLRDHIDMNKIYKTLQT
jgi:adenosylcobyric acid synthase